MRYFITGADRDTGADVRLTIEAVTPDEAERYARSKGMLVATIAVEPSNAADPTPPSEGADVHSPSRQLHGGVTHRAVKGRAILITGIVLMTIAGAVWYYRREAKHRDCELSIMWIEVDINARAAGIKAGVEFGKTQTFMGSADQAVQAEAAFKEWESADLVWRSIRARKSIEDQLLMTGERKAREANLKIAGTPELIRDHARLLREMAMQWR